MVSLFTLARLVLVSVLRVEAQCLFVEGHRAEKKERHYQGELTLVNEEISSWRRDSVY